MTDRFENTGGMKRRCEEEEGKESIYGARSPLSVDSGLLKRLRETAGVLQYYVIPVTPPGRWFEEGMEGSPCEDDDELVGAEELEKGVEEGGGMVKAQGGGEVGDNGECEKRRREKIRDQFRKHRALLEVDVKVEEEIKSVGDQKASSTRFEDSKDASSPNEEQSTIPSLPMSQLRRFRRFDCEACGKLFRTSRDVRQHFQVVHENIKSYVCDTCGVAFGLKGNLVKHQRNMHVARRISFSCNTCHRVFSMKGNLTKHIQTVHERLRPFACDLCSALFSRRSNLNQHRHLIHKTPSTVKSLKHEESEPTRQSSPEITESADAEVPSTL
uniref:C2H2-type domain-containing protein n=1 Tax=Compsopogon caeruleus TaxID=31354 RepID=A0A7S1TIR1_9RHOD|mmetsp:Transcript_8450/g.17164  ORF Transcript_8450/g.17164 Transcript_8450/m.17164 type:complete len:328 (+) Transcript_8450:1-984(+)